jgi:tetratricopeptide (TPR) repeat protein
MEIDKNALPDPTLAPRKSTFSFVADPNHYRMIEVPLYRTGTIEGAVYRKNAQEALSGVGGIRLILTGEDDKSETLRTFSDGSFYTYGITPGKYTLSIDPQQLSYIGMDSNPNSINIEIKAVPDGDYLEGLNFELVTGEREPEKPKTPEMLPEKVTQVNTAISTFIKAQQYLNESNFEAALEAIVESLGTVTSGEALLLKGTIYLEMGKRELAKEYMDDAQKLERDNLAPIE